MLLKNMKLFLKETPFLSFMFFLTQTIAVVIMMVAYGMYMNINYDLEKSVDDKKTYSFATTGWPGNTKMPTSYLLDNCPEMFEEYADVISSVGVRVFIRTELGICECRSDFSLVNENGKLVYGMGEIDERYYKPYVAGAWFTSDDYNDAVKEVIIPYKLRELGEEQLNLYGENYIIKTYEEEKPKEDGPLCGMMNTMFIPLEAIPQDAKVVDITLFLNRPISMGEYRVICESFQRNFGEFIKIPRYNRIEIKDTNAFKSMQYSAIGIALLASLTVGIILRYILMKRSKMTAIYRILGKTQIGVTITYFIELVIYVAGSIGLGILIFMKILKGILIKYYDYFEIIFEDNSYMRYIQIYSGIILLSSLFVVVISNMKSPYEQLRSILK